MGILKLKTDDKMKHHYCARYNEASDMISMSVRQKSYNNSNVIKWWRFHIPSKNDASDIVVVRPIFKR